MSFKAQGVRVPSSFAKNSTRSQYQERDRLVEVIEYHIAPDPSQSYMKGREIDPDGPNNGRIVNVSIRDRGTPRTASATGADGKPRKWSGDIIDDKMRTHIGPGSWVALERTSVERKFKEGDAEGYVLKANYINRLEPSPDKSCRAIFTISAKDSRVFQVQKWDRQTTSYMNDAEVSALADKMDAVAANWKASEAARAAGGQALPPEPGIGVQFRAIIETEEKDRAGKPIYQVIDCTPPIDWISKSEDAAGNAIPGHPVTGEQMKTFLSQYDQYLSEQFPDKPTLADGTPNPKYNKDYAELTVEIMTFRTFWTSKMSSNLVIRDKSPLWRMVNRPTLCSMEEPDANDNPHLSEKNWAVDGIMALSADKAQIVNGQPVIDRRQFVQGLYPNGYMASVHSLVRSSNGMMVKPHPKLNYQAPEATTANNATAAPQAGSRPASGSAPSDGGLRPAAGAVRDPFGDGFEGGPDPLDGGGKDVYGEMLSGAGNGTGTAVPPVSAPDPQPMAPSAPAPAPTGRRRSV